MCVIEWAYQAAAAAGVAGQGAAAGLQKHRGTATAAAAAAACESDTTGKAEVGDDSCNDHSCWLDGWPTPRRTAERHGSMHFVACTALVTLVTLDYARFMR